VRSAFNRRIGPRASSSGGSRSHLAQPATLTPPGAAAEAAGGRCRTGLRCRGMVAFVSLPRPAMDRFHRASAVCFRRLRSRRWPDAWPFTRTCAALRHSRPSLRASSDARPFRIRCRIYASMNFLTVSLTRPHCRRLRPRRRGAATTPSRAAAPAGRIGGVSHRFAMGSVQPAVAARKRRKRPARWRRKYAVGFAGGGHPCAAPVSVKRQAPPSPQQRFERPVLSTDAGLGL